MSQVSPQPTFFNDGIFTTYLCMLKLSCVRAWPLNQHFVMTYSPLIFDLPVCVNCRSSSRQPAFLMTYLWLIFVCVTLYAKRLSRPFNQRFLMTYSWFIFGCVGCLAQTVPVTATIPLFGDIFRLENTLIGETWLSPILCFFANIYLANVLKFLFCES